MRIFQVSPLAPVHQDIVGCKCVDAPHAFYVIGRIGRNRHEFIDPSRHTAVFFQIENMAHAAGRCEVKRPLPVICGDEVKQHDIILVKLIPAYGPVNGIDHFILKV